MNRLINGSFIEKDGLSYYKTPYFRSMRKKEGFKGQRTLILPDFLLSEIQKDALGSQLYVTDLGYYPNACYHHRIRKNGCEQYILIYCVEGEGWCSINGKRNLVSANQFFIIPQGVPHAYGSSDKHPWSIYWLHFSGTQAQHFIDITGNTKSIIPCKISRIEDRIQLFEEIIQNLEMGYSHENIHYANICLWHFLGSFKYISQFRQIRTIRELDVIEDSILFMKEHLANKITLKDISEQCGLSPSHFSMLFKAKTSRTPMDYLIHLRIQKACQLLDASNQRIKEIARMVSYDDPYYFSRIFKKTMNISPLQYQKTLKG